MKMFYVMGGGMGHLYRVRTFINQCGFSSFKIVTNNPLATKLFRQHEIVWAKGETAEELSISVQSIFHNCHQEELYVDAFPAGLFGELHGLRFNKIIYLARRLKWQNYKAILPSDPLYFEETYRLEELEEEHEAWVQQQSSSTASLSITYAPPRPDRIPAELIPSGQAIWLIVHAFIIEEVEALVSYAKEMARLENQSPAIVLLTDKAIADDTIFCRTYFPANDWFPIADRIFTGGGFNTMQQVVGFREKLKLLPFPRKYDDQGWRVSTSNITFTVGDNTNRVLK